MLGGQKCVYGCRLATDVRYAKRKLQKPASFDQESLVSTRSTCGVKRCIALPKN